MDIKIIKKIMIIILAFLIIAIMIRLAKCDNEIGDNKEINKEVVDIEDKDKVVQKEEKLEKEKNQNIDEENPLDIEVFGAEIKDVYIYRYSDILDYMSDYKEASKLKDLIIEKITSNIRKGEETVKAYRMESILYDEEKGTLSFIINSMEETESTYSAIVNREKTELRKLR